MPLGFSFRPKELRSASDQARRILRCFLCGDIVKKSTTNNINNRGYVGRRNDKLLGMLGNCSSTDEAVLFVASYYSRLAEYFHLQQQKQPSESGDGPALVSQNNLAKQSGLKSRQEQSGLKSLLYQSMNTTIQAYLKISRTKLMDKYGWKLLGGLTVPNEKRPFVFQQQWQHHNNIKRKRFKPWTCVRNDGCCCLVESNIQKEKKEEVALLPEELERQIISIVEGTSYRLFNTLERKLQQLFDTTTSSSRSRRIPKLVSILKQLQQEQKVLLNLAEMPNRPSARITNTGRRRLLHLERQMVEKNREMP